MGRRAQIALLDFREPDQAAFDRLPPLALLAVVLLPPVSAWATAWPDLAPPDFGVLPPLAAAPDFVPVDFVPLAFAVVDFEPPDFAVVVLAPAVLPDWAFVDWAFVDWALVEPDLVDWDFVDWLLVC
jgi:hypothetical protein